MSQKHIKTTNVDLHSELKRIFGFDKFKGRQEEVIKSLLAGNDTFVIMPTGGGKSMCYQLPALILPGCAIIVSPLISLMKNLDQFFIIKGTSNGSFQVATEAVLFIILLKLTIC